LVIEREQALSEAAEKISHVWTVLANLAKPEIISGIVCCYCVANVLVTVQANLVKPEIIPAAESANTQSANVLLLYC
jgi:hypothetical protein